MESDFKLITPLKSPASDGLYFTVIFSCCMGAIFSILGSTESRAPWLCENYTRLLALPEFLMEIVSMCYLPNLRNPMLTKG